MNIIVIKHYMCDIDDDYREINMSEFPRVLKQMKAYARSCEKDLIYVTVKNPSTDGLPVDSDAYAEVEYTGDLCDSERKQYVSFLNRLSMNEEYTERSDRKRRHCVLKAIRFKKIDGDILTA